MICRHSSASLYICHGTSNRTASVVVARTKPVPLVNTYLWGRVCLFVGSGINMEAPGN